MTTDRRLLGAALGIALAVAACGGSSASPAASGSAASQAPAATPPAATEPAASDAGVQPSGPDISFVPGAASDLEGMLPSNVGTITFTKTSMDGSKLAGAGTPLDSSKMDPLLSKYGKTIADVRVAIATGTDSAPPSAGAIPIPTMIYALQLKGVPASDWASQLVASDNSASPMPSMTLGGKQVQGQSESGFTNAYYTKDDIMFMVIAPDKDADAILAALP